MISSRRSSTARDVEVAAHRLGHAGDAADLGQQLARPQQRLRRHAGVEGALAADQMRLDDRHAQTGLAQPPAHTSPAGPAPRITRRFRARSCVPGTSSGSRTCHCLLCAVRSFPHGHRRPVLKPDYVSHRKHFILTEEHDQLRESIRSFVTKELAPHAEEWEETTFPTRLQAHGRARLPGPRVSRGVRRPGRRLLLHLVLAEEMVHSNSAASRWAWRCTPTWPPRRSSCSAPRSRSRTTSCPRSAARRSPASASPSPTRDPTWPASRPMPCATATCGSSTARRLHHQRPSGRLHRARHQDRPGCGLRRLLAVPRRHGLAGRDPREKLEKPGMHASETALLAFQDVRVPADALLGRRARASTTSCGSSRASG